MSSYYDDPDFADEYRRRDEEALDQAIEEKEEAIRTESLCVCGYPSAHCYVHNSPPIIEGES